MKTHYPTHRACTRLLAIPALALTFVCAAHADYKSAILSDHPVGYWPLNEDAASSGGIAFDASGNGNNGIYQSAVAIGVAGVPNPPFTGFAANSLAAGFQGWLGDSSCVTLTNLPINSATVTITEWLYATDPNNLGTSFWNASQNAGLAYSGTSLGYNWHGGDGWQWTFSAFTPPLNQWVFVAMVTTPTNTVFYMGDENGLLSKVNNDGNSAVNFTTGTSIGGPFNGSTTGFNGSLSDVAVFDYSLTPVQVSQLFIAGSGYLPPPAAPTDMSAAAGNKQVSISWTASPGATSYTVKRATTSGSETTIASTTGTAYTDSGLANGTTYYYEVFASNSGGTSDASLEVSATPNGTITSYNASVLALSPIGFWPLNETSGTTAADISGNGYNGVYQSAVGLGVAGVPNSPYVGFAANSRAANFSGSSGDSSCVTLANLPVNSANITIMQWIYPTNPSRLGTSFWNAGQNAGFGCNGTALGYNWHGGSGWQWNYAGFTPPVNQWSFVALVITPTNAAFYMGNAAGLQSEINNDPNTSVDFTTGTAIGGPNNGGTSGYNGLLSDVAIFDYSLSPAQITQLFANSGGYEMPPDITAQPVSHNVYAGGTTSFDVAASGSEPLSYQWRQGTSALAGQTNALLTLGNIQASAAGNYSVVITNNYGAVTSSVATLTIATKPVAYEKTVQADSPIGYWPLDLGTDTSMNKSGQYLADDLSGNGNKGTYNSMSQFNQTFGPSAFIPNGATFNGNGQFVDLSTGTNTSVLNIGGQITMEAWAQPNAFQVSNPGDIFAKGYDFFHNYLEDAISVNNGNFVGGRDSGYFVAGNAAGTNWSHVVCTYDGAQWNLYVNGQLVGTNADLQGASAEDIPWAIGNGTLGGGGRYFTGNICQVALYSNALTLDRVLAHYCMGVYGTTNVAPIITGQPISQRAITNTTASFTVNVVASPLPTYQWYLVSGGKTNVIDGANSATYTTPAVKDSDAGNGYFVIVNNAVGQVTSAIATLAAGHMITASGFLECDEYYGNYTSDLQALGALSPTVALPTPDKVEYLNSFNDKQDLPNNSGERIHGWFTPQVTGNYVFFVAGDDASVLWLSTDSNPANVHEIAQNQAWMWNAAGPDWNCSNTGNAEYSYYSTGEFRSDLFELNGGPSAYANLTGTWSSWPGLNADGSIPLVAGTRYYIELDHYQGSGGQNATVTYKLASDADPVPGDTTLLTGSTVGAQVPDTLIPQSQPVITSIQTSGSNVIMSGTNGVANAVYNVMTSTNIAAPLSNWTILRTQQFDANGNFSVTNTVTADAPQQFYLLQIPN